MTKYKYIYELTIKAGDYTGIHEVQHSADSLSEANAYMTSYCDITSRGCDLISDALSKSVGFPIKVINSASFRLKSIQKPDIA